jgi:aspartyl-tRNA synthetase
MTTSAWDRPWCASLGRDNLDERVEVVGWVRRRRDLGGLVFVDLRDRSGLLQLVFEEAMVAEGEKLSAEDVVRVFGTVRERAQGQTNTELASGEIEIAVEELEVLNSAETPPFVVEDRVNASEELRLTHRYDARGGARFPGAVANPQRVVLRLAAVTTALQAAPPGRRLRALYAGLTVLP